MKKVLALAGCIFLLCGCQCVNDMSIDDCLVFSKEVTKANTYRVGYKYYLPDRLLVDSTGDFTQVLSNDKYNFYLYVDVVSHLNKTKFEFDEKPNAYYSKKFKFDDKIGYIEINSKENDKYLIEIMYNYAKIEVMVDASDLNATVITAVNVLNNIVYNDIAIENYFGDDVLNYTEEDFDIFKTEEKSEEYLDFE